MTFLSSPSDSSSSSDDPSSDWFVSGCTVCFWTTAGVCGVCGVCWLKSDALFRLRQELTAAAVAASCPSCSVPLTSLDSLGGVAFCSGNTCSFTSRLLGFVLTAAAGFGAFPWSVPFVVFAGFFGGSSCLNFLLPGPVSKIGWLWTRFNSGLLVPVPFPAQVSPPVFEGRPPSQNAFQRYW